MEWSRAAAAWQRLQGQCLVAIAPGNHDRDDCVSPPTGTGSQWYPNFNSYFAWIDPALSGQGNHYTNTMDNHYPGIQNAYWRKTIAGLPFLFLTLEFNTTTTPTNYTDWNTESDLIGWARGVISSTANDLVVLVTHDYIEPSDSTPPLGPHGDYVWGKLIDQCPNVVMVLCGHTGPTSRFDNTNDYGRVVNELLFNYQGWDALDYPPADWDWYIAMLRTSAVARLMTIDPLSNRIRVKDWGCEMGGWLGLPEDNFEFTLPVDPRP